MPIVAVTLDDLAKFAPKFTPRLVALKTPFVTAAVLVTAFPNVFTRLLPTVLDHASLADLVKFLLAVSVAVFVNDSAIL